MNDSSKIETLQNKILALEARIDSISNFSSLKQLEYEMHSKTDVLESVNAFYDSAWIKLLIVISILGVVIPIIAQYFQKQNLKDLTNFIGTEIKDRFDTRLSELKQYNQDNISSLVKQYTDKFETIEKENENTLREVDASLFYLQGRSTLLENNIIHATTSFIKSADLWLQSSRPERSSTQFTNLMRAIKKIKNTEMLSTIDRLLIEKYKYSNNLTGILSSFKTHEEVDIEKINQLLDQIEKIKNNEAS